MWYFLLRNTRERTKFSSSFSIVFCHGDKLDLLYTRNV